MSIIFVLELLYLPTNVSDSNKTFDYLNYSATDLHYFLNEYQIQSIGKDSVIYSLVGYGMLGYALENIYQLGFNELIITKIAQPLHMTRTGLNYSSRSDNNYADGYQNGEKINWLRNDFCVINASGGIRSCLKDLQIFVKAEAGLIKTPLYSAMKKTQKIQFLGSNSPIGRSHICLGWGKMSNGFFGHFGGTQGFCAFAGFNPDQKKTMVFLANSNNIQKCIPWMMDLCMNEMNKE